MLCDGTVAKVQSDEFCLNPCFSGICSVTSEREDLYPFHYKVSILVLVEYAL